MNEKTLPAVPPGVVPTPHTRTHAHPARMFLAQNFAERVPGGQGLAKGMPAWPWWPGKRGMYVLFYVF